MRVDDAGNHGPALEIDHRQSATAPHHGIADRGETAVADKNLRYDAAGAIHRVDASVDEADIARTACLALSVQPQSGSKRHSGDGGRSAADELPARKAAASVGHDREPRVVR